MVILISFCVLLTSAHYDPAYFRSSKDPFIFYKDWMKNISNDKMLSELALPGTHDSGTFKINYLLYTTQAINFKQQLEYGIRVFDIRFRHSNDKFELFHGPIFLKVTFDEFLDSVNEFLLENPSETVLFRLSKERPDNINNIRNRKETLDWYLTKYPNTFKRITENVKLGEIRGKFIMISYEEEFREYGISKQLFDIQDKYLLKNMLDLYNKWLAVRSHLNKATHGANSQLYMNYLTGSGSALPFFVASGHGFAGTWSPRLTTTLTSPPFIYSLPDFPRVNCFFGVCTIVYEGTNTLTRDYIKGNTCSKRTVGIIMADFPGTDLIAEIIRNNFNYDFCKYAYM